MSHKITATVFDKKGRILSRETNSYSKTHTQQYLFARSVGKPNSIYLHAEIAALIRSINHGVPHKILIERYKKNGEAGLAMPCSICQRAIKFFGVKKVEYTQ